MKRTNILLIALFISLTSNLFNCSESPNGTNTPDLNIKTAKVLIVNQGIWGGANGTLTVYDVDEDTLYNNVLELGNVANCIVINNNKGFVINSTSNNVMVLDLSGEQISASNTITELNNPWSAAFLNDHLYITNQLGSNVSVIDINQNVIIKEIDVGVTPQGIYAINNKVYVANSGFTAWGEPYLPGKISVISKDNVVTEITAGINPQGFAADSEDNLYVVCAGDYGATTNGKVYKIDTNNDTVTDSLEINGTPNYITNDGNDNFLILGFMFSLHKVDFSQKTVTQINEKTGSCLAVDREGNIYLGEPSADFISPGNTLLYDSEFNLIKTMSVGIGPASIAFLEEEE